MRKILRSLAAATAATAALSVIPLALAGAASASTTPAPVPMLNWAGYVATTPTSYHIANQFGWVQANFTVPKVTCSDSTVSAIYTHLRPSGSLYAAGAFWVGFGGVGKTERLEQAGVQVWCQTKTSAPQYGAFYEMVPVPSRGGATNAPLYNKAGKHITVHAGDRMVAAAWDDFTQSQATSHHYAPGHKYRFLVTDLTQGAMSRIPLQAFSHGALGNDNNAEVITEVENNGPWSGPLYSGIPHFQPVKYSSIHVGMNGGGYTYGIGQGPSWTAAKYYVHGGLLGLLGLTSPHTLISTGALSQAGTAFTNTWVKF
jgi:hypothetical protein